LGVLYAIGGVILIVEGVMVTGDWLKPRIQEDDMNPIRWLRWLIVHAGVFVFIGIYASVNGLSGFFALIFAAWLLVALLHFLEFANGARLSRVYKAISGVDGKPTRPEGFWDYAYYALGFFVALVALLLTFFVVSLYYGAPAYDAWYHTYFLVIGFFVAYPICTLLLLVLHVRKIGGLETPWQKELALDLGEAILLLYVFLVPAIGYNV
jgi:hypothetical protein